MPGTAVNALSSPAAIARLASSGPSTETAARAVRGPTPETPSITVNTSFSSAREKPKSRGDSSFRAMYAVCRRVVEPTRSPARVWVLAWTSTPKPATSTTASVVPTNCTSPVTEAITVRSPLPAPRGWSQWRRPRRRGARPCATVPPRGQPHTFEQMCEYCWPLYQGPGT